MSIKLDLYVDLDTFNNKSSILNVFQNTVMNFGIDQ